jgi:hypothetical protein
MSVLSPALIDQLRRATPALAFPDTYEVRRATKVSDDAGGQVETVQTVEQGRCLLTPGGIQPNERTIADRAGYQRPIVVILPYATLLAETDTLVVNGRRTLEVGGVNKAETWGVVARAICEERG